MPVRRARHASAIRRHPPVLAPVLLAPLLLAPRRRAITFPPTLTRGSTYRRDAAKPKSIPPIARWSSEAYGEIVLTGVLTRRLAPERATPAALAIGAVGACALVALVDPNEGGRYPACPTRALLGIDCPACGTLRGIHALTRGQIGTALDHNLLLALAVPVGIVVWWRWVRGSLGLATRPLTRPDWAIPVLVVVATAFAIARNLPFEAVAWLASDA
jgi:hypothetical protein